MIIALVKWDNEKSRYVTEAVEAAGVVFSFYGLKKGRERIEVTPRRNVDNEVVVKCRHGSITLSPTSPNQVIIGIRETAPGD